MLGLFPAILVAVSEPARDHGTPFAICDRAVVSEGEVQYPQMLHKIHELYSTIHIHDESDAIVREPLYPFRIHVLNWVKPIYGFRGRRVEVRTMRLPANRLGTNFHVVSRMIGKTALEDGPGIRGHATLISVGMCLDK